jgi:simple sugar transport system permease protein
VSTAPAPAPGAPGTPGSPFAKAWHAVTARGAGVDVGALRTGVAALVATLLLVGLLIAALGQDPLEAYRTIVSGSLGAADNIGQTLMVAVPLALCGLAAAIPFTARLWNVGAEGQMHLGAFAAVAVGLTLPELPGPVFIPLILAGAMVAGAAWAAIAGALKALVGANEVIVTLMLNFIAILIATYAITGIWPQDIAPQTEKLPESAALPVIWSGTVVNAGLLITLAAVAIAWLIMRRTALGLQIRSIGLNPYASRMNGMSVGRLTVATFALAGVFAGLAGAILVLGENLALVTNFSANYGYLGIAVALVARLSPAWVLPSALLFACLQVGSQSLPAATGISTAFGQIIIATFVLALLGARVIRLRYAEGAVG